MKYSLHLDNVIIFQNKPIDKSIKKMFEEAIKINSKIFHTNLKKKVSVYFCSNYSEIYTYAKIFHKWSTASVENNKIIIRTIDWIEKIGKFTKKDIKKLIIHEFNHIFWNQEYELTNPVWLVEGFASYIGNDVQFTNKDLRKIIRDYKIDDLKFIEYRFLRRNFSAGDYPRYPLWAGFTKFLADSYSINHIIKFMDKYSQNPIKTNYYDSFIKVFNKSLVCLFADFLDSLEVNRQS